MFEGRSVNVWMTTMTTTTTSRHTILCFMMYGWTNINGSMMVVLVVMVVANDQRDVIFVAHKSLTNNIVV